MDFSTAFGATFRTVGKGQRDGKLTHIMRASRSYPTSLDELWSALTEKRRIQRWFADVSGEFEPGGRFSFQGNADGEIITCEPPRMLALTWEFGGTVSWVTVTIDRLEGEALLTLEHEILTDEKSHARWEQYGPGATGVGWELAVFSLGAYLSNDGQMVREAAEAWAESAPGKATLRTWAAAWGEAQAKAGTPAQTAQDAAQRTAAFYTRES